MRLGSYDINAVGNNSHSYWWDAFAQIWSQDARDRLNDNFDYTLKAVGPDGVQHAIDQANWGVVALPVASSVGAWGTVAGEAGTALYAYGSAYAQQALAWTVGGGTVAATLVEGTGGGGGSGSVTSSAATVSSVFANVADDALVHFSQVPNAASLLENGVLSNGGLSHFFQVGDIRNMTAVEIRALIGNAAPGGVRNDLAVIVSPDAATFRQVTTQGFPNYVSSDTGIPVQTLKVIQDGNPGK